MLGDLHLIVSWTSGSVATEIQAGLLGRLADHECGHGRLAVDRTPACGCWPQEGAAVLILSARRSDGGSSREAA